MWQDDVLAALDAIPNATACFVYPADWPAGTVITYAGLNDTPGSFADDEEYTTEITVKVDAWDFDPEKVRGTVALIKSAMSGIGFTRTYCLDLFEASSRLHHTTMRFRRIQPTD